MRGRFWTAVGHLTLQAAQSGFVLGAALLLSLFNIPYMFPGALTEAGPEVLLAVLVADLVVLGPLLATRLSGGPRVRSPGALFLALLGLAGVRVLVLGRLLQEFGVPGINTGRMVLSGVLFLGTMVLLIIPVGAVQSAVRRQQRTDWLRGSIADIGAETRLLMDEEREGVLRDVCSAVLPALARLPDQDPATGAQSLRVVAHHIVRPLSYALVAAPAPLAVGSPRITQYRLDVRELMIQATRLGRLPTVGLGVALSALGYTYHLLMPSAGLPGMPAVLAGIIVTGLCALCNRLFAHRIAQLTSAMRAVAITGLLAGCGAVIFALFWPAAAGVPQFLISNLLVPPILGWLLILMRTVGHGHRDSQVTLAALEDRLTWELARSNARLRAQRRELARILHGRLQAALNAAVVRVERAGGSVIGESTAADVGGPIRQALAELTGGGEPDVNLALALARTQGIWRGLCEVRVVDPQDQALAVQADAVAAQAVADIVTEGSSNAVRHGDATTVTVELSRPRDDIIRVRIVDDGNGLHRHAKPGLGTAFLEAVTVSWQRTGDLTGTVLQADVPTSVGRVNPAGQSDVAVRLPEQLRPLTDSTAEG